MLRVQFHLAVDNPVQSQLFLVERKKTQRQLLYTAMKCCQPVTKDNVVTEDEWMHK